MPFPYALGAVPSQEDIRDYPLVRRVPQSAKPPRRLDLRPLFQPRRDQGQEGTCVGHAVTTAMGFHQRTRQAPGAQAPDDEILSPRDAYWQARQRVPVNGDGAEPRAALKMAQTGGVLTELVAPYVPGQRDWAPPSGPGVDLVGDRARNRIRTYRRVGASDLEGLALAIHQHGPMVYTLEVDDAFGAGGRDGTVIHPGGPKAGWHAVVAAGYDLDLGALILINSWGLDWGIQGGQAHERGTALWSPHANHQGEAYTLDPEDAPGLPFWPMTERLARAIPGLGSLFLDA